MRSKPLAIFVIAEQFYWAGKTAARIPYEASRGNPYYAIGRGLPNMPAAAVTCLAFSLELYFKCLIRMGKKPVEAEHNLSVLFKAVGRTHQAAIKRHFRHNNQVVRAYLEREYVATGRPVPKADFDYVLSTSEDAFTIMRYLYEKGLPAGKGWLADDIVEGARQTILAKHPDWLNMRQDAFGEVIVLPTSQAR